MAIIKSTGNVLISSLSGTFSAGAVPLSLIDVSTAKGYLFIEVTVTNNNARHIKFEYGFVRYLDKEEIYEEDMDTTPLKTAAVINKNTTKSFAYYININTIAYCAPFIRPFSTNDSIRVDSGSCYATYIE